jgi:hypothetical protein
MAYKSNSLPPATRAIMIGTGGLLGGGAFVLANMANSYSQKDINKSNSKPNGPFYANSIIEEGDSVE